MFKKLEQYVMVFSIYFVQLRIAPQNPKTHKAISNDLWKINFNSLYNSSNISIYFSMHPCLA
jgi:hypothetical protein